MMKGNFIGQGGPIRTTSRHAGLPRNAPVRHLIEFSR